MSLVEIQHPADTPVTFLSNPTHPLHMDESSLSSDGASDAGSPPMTHGDDAHSPSISSFLSPSDLCHSPLAPMRVQNSDMIYVPHAILEDCSQRDSRCAHALRVRYLEDIHFPQSENVSPELGTRKDRTRDK